MDALRIQAVPEGLRRPILIMAFGGWNDAAESATTAVRYLGTSFHAEKFAEVDPEEFYHFGLARPLVRFKPGSETEREITWPATEFSISQASELARDVIVGVAIEPHLRWKTYCNTVVDLARRCEVALVLTLGALLAEGPHTQPVRLSGSASDPELAVRLGVRPSKYEGPTGIVGVLNTICREQGFATATLWANVPHYISGIENPKATLALVRRVAPLLGATLDVGDLEDAGKQFDANL
jgi:proteasome assembly chaperone (PAC2) family protein